MRMNWLSFNCNVFSKARILGRTTQLFSVKHFPEKFSKGKSNIELLSVFSDSEAEKNRRCIDRCGSSIDYYGRYPAEVKKCVPKITFLHF